MSKKHQSNGLLPSIIDGSMNWNTKILNDQSYFRYYQELMELCITRFKWEGLPSTIDTRHLEYLLYQYGYCVILQDPKTLRWICSRVSFASPMDVNDNYLEYLANGNNGYTQKCAPDGFLVLGEDGLMHESVLGAPGILVWDNLSRLPLYNICQLYARRLSDCDRSADVQVSNSKNPLVISAPAEQKNTILQEWRQVQMGEPAILKTNQTNFEESYEVLKTDIPFTANEIFEYKTKLMHEFKEFIGLTALPMERVNVAEIDTVEDYPELRRLSYLTARRDCLGWLKEHSIESAVVFRRDDESLLHDVQTNIAVAHKYDLLNNDNQGQGGANNNAVSGTKSTQKKRSNK